MEGWREWRKIPAFFFLLLVSLSPRVQGQEDKGISPEGKHPTLEDLGHKLDHNFCTLSSHDLT